MYRAIRRISLVIGVVLMFAALVMFGFFETGVSNVEYMLLWILSAGAIRYGANVDLRI